MKKIVSNIIIAILLIIVLFLAFCFVQTNVMGKEYPQIEKYTFFQVKTGSMENTIKIDDIIIVKINENYSTGDIITYKEGQTFITHRVVEINDDKVITKGDNNNTQDEAIKKEAVLGKVVYTVKNIGIWKKVFSDPKVIISSIITIILFVITINYEDKKEK